MIQIKKIELVAGDTVMGCASCGDVAYWVIEGIENVYFCHPHLCILSGEILKTVEE